MQELRIHISMEQGSQTLIVEGTMALLTQLMSTLGVHRSDDVGLQDKDTPLSRIDFRHSEGVRGQRENYVVS